MPCYHFGNMLRWYMRIIALSTLRTFWEKHPTPNCTRNWHAEASRANWRNRRHQDGHRNASFTANNRVVFNIKGNDYRLVAVHYDRDKVRPP